MANHHFLVASFWNLLFEIVGSQEEEKIERYCSPVVLPGFEYYELDHLPVQLSYSHSGDQTTFTTYKALNFGPFEESTSTLEWSGIRAELSEIRFKMPAEHHLGPIVYPLELQFKHTIANGRFVMMSLLFEEGIENQVLADLFWYIDPADLLFYTHGVNLDRLVRNLGVPTSSAPYSIIATQYLQYNGSLTDGTATSCDGTIWIVFYNLQSVSSDQLAFIQELVGVQENAFPLENWNQRTILGGKHVTKDWGMPISAPVNVVGENIEISTDCKFLDNNCQPPWHFVLVGLASISLMIIIVSCLVWCSMAWKSKMTQKPRYALATPPPPPLTQAPVQYQVPDQRRWGNVQRQKTMPAGGRIGEIRCDGTGYCWVVGEEDRGKKVIREDEVEFRPLIPHNNNMNIVKS